MKKTKERFEKLSIEELNNLRDAIQKKFGLVSIDKEDIRHYYKTGKYYSTKERG